MENIIVLLIFVLKTKYLNYSEKFQNGKIRNDIPKNSKMEKFGTTFRKIPEWKKSECV